MPQRKMYLALPLFAAGALFAQYPKPAQEPLYRNVSPAPSTLTQPPPKNNNLAPLDVNQSPATTTSPEVLTVTMEAPKGGAKSVTGTIVGNLPDKATGKLQVLDGNVGHQPIDLTIDTTKKTFQATLDNALHEGQTLQILIFNADGVLVAFADEPVATLEFDWGRARATFSAGALYVRSNGSFGSAEPFLALGVDYNIFNSQIVPTCANRPKFEMYALVHRRRTGDTLFDKSVARSGADIDRYTLPAMSGRPVIFWSTHSLKAALHRFRFQRLRAAPDRPPAARPLPRPKPAPARAEPAPPTPAPASSPRKPAANSKWASTFRSTGHRHAGRRAGWIRRFFSRRS